MSELLAGPAEDFDLSSLVEHAEAVEASATVEAVQQQFDRHGHEFAAVVSGARVVGICSRGHVRGLLSGRYGFALHHRSPISQHMLRQCLAVRLAQPLRAVLEAALGRDGEPFYEDVVLVSDTFALVGLIPPHRLVKVQSALMNQQFEVVAAQRAELQRANRELSHHLEHRRVLEKEIVAKEKAALVETLAGGIAHEINNKLMPIVGYAQLLLEEMGPAGLRALTPYCQTILDSALDSARIIRQLLQLSRPTPTEQATHDLREILDQSLTLVALRLRETGVSVRLDLPEAPVPVRLDAAQIKQLVVNLALNAADSMENAETRQLAIGIAIAGERARLSIRDTGTGIDEQHVKRIFDPFFTTKAPNRGTGLGLSVCLAIARQHDAEMTVESALAEGTTVHVEFPLDRNRVVEAARAAEPLPAPAAANARRVLVVDDEEAVGRFVEHALKRTLGCQVDRVADGHAALASLTSREFALVLSDIRMPGLNGVELLEWITRHRPDLLPNLIFMTGDAGGSALNSSISARGIPMLRKPFTIQTLVEHSRSRLDRSA